MSQIVQIGLDVTSSAGGSATAFNAVRNAIGGKAISFTGDNLAGMRFSRAMASTISRLVVVF